MRFQIYKKTLCRDEFWKMEKRNSKFILRNEISLTFKVLTVLLA